MAATWSTWRGMEELREKDCTSLPDPCISLIRTPVSSMRPNV